MEDKDHEYMMHNLQLKVTDVQQLEIRVHLQHMQ